MAPRIFCASRLMCPYRPTAGLLHCPHNRKAAGHHHASWAAETRVAPIAWGEWCALIGNEQQLHPLPTGTALPPALRLAGMVARRAPGLLHQRHHRQSGSERVSRALCGWWFAQPALSSSHDGQGAGLCVCHGRLQFTQDRQKAPWDVAFRVLAAENFPAHRTIRDFRFVHLKEFTDLFVQVVRLARELGLVKLGTIAVDGTKIKANASRHKAMSYVRMQAAEVELKEQIAALLKRAATTDEAEKNEPELDIPAEIERRQARLAAIEAAKVRLEERQRQADALRGRTPDDERKPRDKDGNPRVANPSSVTLVCLHRRPRRALPIHSRAS